jgi:hypothetical protein
MLSKSRVKQSQFEHSFCLHLIKKNNLKNFSRFLAALGQSLLYNVALREPVANKSKGLSK